MDLSKLGNIAIEAALAAGKVIQKYVDKDVRVERKETGASYASQVVTVVDRACEAAIFAHLQPTLTKDQLALLSEETEDDGSRFEKDYFWCIDPMDGTLPFIHKKPGFSVSVALVTQDGVPCIGVVFDPSTGNLYHAVKGYGAFKNDQPLEIKNSNKHLTYVTDRRLQDTPNATKIERLLHESVEKLGLEGMVEMAGSGAVLSSMHVLENGPACMMKLPKEERGGGSLWDYAATACIYHELGLPATNFEGGRLDLNRKDSTFMNHQGVFYGNLGIKS